MSGPARTVRLVCGFLALWDVGLALVALVAPGLIHTLVHPTTAPAGLWWIQRTAWVWGAFAFAEIAASCSPASGERARLVGFLRAMDVPADLTWLVAGPPVGTLGRLILTIFPAINVALAVVLFSAARALDREK